MIFYYFILLLSVGVFWIDPMASVVILLVGIFSLLDENRRGVGK